jgi:SAM-dependent methyltransferase
MHQSSLANMRSFRDHYLDHRRLDPLTILDLGSMDIHGCYRPLFDAPAWTYTGLDLEPGPNVDVVLKRPYDWREIPTASADVFISGQCFEHIEFFWLTILEIERVLKVGGLVCLLAPSGGFEHRYPVDCWRFYPDGFAALARFAGLEALEAEFPAPAQEYTDDSGLWKDCRLVARKPKSNVRARLGRTTARWILRRMVGR